MRSFFLLICQWIVNAWAKSKLVSINNKIARRPKGDKYRHKSEVVKYDAAEDQTAFKRKGETEGQQETPAKKKTKKEKVKEEPQEERTVVVNT